MANLKDINYGIGKYLVPSDASSLPDIATNRKNLDLLNFKVAVNNAYSLYNFKDGMIDAYQTEDGVDTGTSTNEIYDSSGKYYSGAAGPTGGTITTHGSYTVNTFLTTANFVVGAAGNIDILMIGGGGSGGSGHQGGGGGGAGGFISISTYPVVAATYVVTVGTGGAGQTNNVGINGVNTTFVGNSKTLTANGGGGGAGDTGDPASTPALAGGSGGGGGRDGQGSPASGNQPSNTSDTLDTYNGTGFGGNGAVGNPGPWGGAGGGGGAGGNGSGGTGGGPTSANEYGGPGGVGKENDYRTGSNVFYAGGGGGSSEYNVAQSGDGGNGGGGKGCNNGTTATAGTANTGGAGGGASNGGTGGAGGSGIVVIRHTTGAVSTPANMTLVSNAQTAQADPTEGRLMLYEEDVDAITLDTDIKGYVSRDGGTTYTQTPLVEDTVYGQWGMDQYTKLMLHCDGANDGTTFTDSSSAAHAITATGGAHTDTAVKKFGTAAGQFDGTGDYLSTPDSSDWNFGTDNFTAEAWFRASSLPVVGGILL